jgi:hypothetical protein
MDVIGKNMRDAYREVFGGHVHDDQIAKAGQRGLVFALASLTRAVLLVGDRIVAQMYANGPEAQRLYEGNERVRSQWERERMMQRGPTDPRDDEPFRWRGREVYGPDASVWFTADDELTTPMLCELLNKHWPRG